MIAVRTPAEIEPEMITEFEQPDAKLSTQYGVIPFLAWLARERERLADDGINSRIFYSGGGRCCLVRCKSKG